MTWIVLLGVAALLGCGDGNHEAEKNLSRGLVSFRYGLRSGLGFCPEPGSVYRAEIRAEEDGTLTIAGSVIASGVGGTDACLPESSNPCWVARPIAGRVLSEHERNVVASTFRDVTIATEDEADCSFHDPCVVRFLTWTNEAANGEETVNARDGSCAPRLRDADARDVTALVTTLLSASP